MLDRLSVPRRAFDFEDYIDILRRNFRWVIGPAFAGIVISTVIAFLLEDRFQSTALIRIVPQQISGDLIRSISSQDVTDRVTSMAQTILSRTTLTNLISTYGLYKEELKREPMEDVLTQMKEDIKIEPIVPVSNLQTRSFPAMRVQFSYRDRFIARKVCEDVVSRFMSASSTDQMQGSLSAATFLSDELDNKKRALDAAEQKLTDYKVRNQGKLPEQMQSNITSMTALEQRLGSLTDSQTHNSQQRMMIDTELQTAKNRLASVKATSGTSAVRNAKALELDNAIEGLQSQIASMQDRYTESYPDLQAAKDRLAVLKRQRDDILAKNSSAPSESGADSVVSAREKVEAQAHIDALQTALSTLRVSDAAINRDIAAVNAQIRSFEGRIQESPAGESEYRELERDREVAKATFEEAQKKKQIAQDSLSMERQKQGETLELLDPASTPSTPTAPKRGIYIPMGLAAGLLLGFILVAIREVRDTSLKNLKDARLYTQLSILGSIPLLENDVVVQRRKQVMWVGWATATILGFAVMGASVAHYFLSKT